MRGTNKTRGEFLLKDPLRMADIYPPKVIQDITREWADIYPPKVIQDIRREWDRQP